MRVTDWCCTRQLQADLSTRQRERGSEAPVQSQVLHGNKECQSRNGDDYRVARDKETVPSTYQNTIVGDVCGREF